VERGRPATTRRGLSLAGGVHVHHRSQKRHHGRGAGVGRRCPAHLARGRGGSAAGVPQHVHQCDHGQANGSRYDHHDDSVHKGSLPTLMAPPGPALPPRPARGGAHPARRSSLTARTRELRAVTRKMSANTNTGCIRLPLPEVRRALRPQCQRRAAEVHAYGLRHHDHQERRSVGGMLARLLPPQARL
jgi:hypothetical protein